MVIQGDLRVMNGDMIEMISWWYHNGWGKCDLVVIYGDLQCELCWKKVNQGFQCILNNDFMLIQWILINKTTNQPFYGF